MPTARLTVLEAASQVGGVIQTEPLDGYLVEHGADMFSTQPPEALQLCRDLGIADQLIEPLAEGRGAMVVRDGRCHPIPEGFVLMRPTRLGAMLRTPLLSWRGKARLFAEPLVRPRRSDADESLASFVRRRLGQETFDRVVQPLVGGIYTADADLLSMQATMPQFVAMERQHGSLLRATRARKRAGHDSRERSSSGARYSQFRGFPEGMRSLFQAIADHLPAETIRTEAPVERLERLPSTAAALGRWRLHLGTADTPLDADGVVLALPAHRFGKLLQTAAPRVKEGTDQIPYASSAIVVLGVRDEDIQRPVQTFGIVVPEIEGRKILACSFASHKFPGRTPPGRTLLRAFVGGAMHPEWLAESDEQLIEWVRDDLKDLIGLRGVPELTRVVRWNHAMPQYHLGHTQLAEQIEQAVAGLPGLEIAGNALHGVGIAPVVRTAREAAERLMQSWGSERAPAQRDKSTATSS